MTKSIKKIAVTGGAGQIAYSLLFRIASGDLLGKDQPIALQILEVEAVLPMLEGVCMELQDCAFPLLKELYISSDPSKAFDQADYAFLVGSKPRGPGMERKDLLYDNGKIFVEQGAALNDYASRDVKVLVVGNPCNTNCLIAMTHAPKLSRKNFHAMTRLDQNRAVHLLAQKAKVEVQDVSCMTIWGNHSSTQVPDFFNAKIQERPVTEQIHDQAWLEKDFIESVQKRGAAIIAARGKSSAASAANAAIDAMKAIDGQETTPWFSSGVDSTDNSYGIQDNLIFSFPCHNQGSGEWKIVEDLEWNEFLKYRIKLSEKELLEEKEMIKDLL